jgi:hypothetical protein
MDNFLSLVVTAVATTSPATDPQWTQAWVRLARPLMPPSESEVQEVDKTIADLPESPDHILAPPCGRGRSRSTYNPMGLADYTRSGCRTCCAMATTSDALLMGWQGHKDPAPAIGPRNKVACSLHLERVMQFVPVFLGVTLILFMMTTVLGSDSSAVRQRAVNPTVYRASNGTASTSRGTGST